MLANCKRCGKLINGKTGLYCTDCQQEENTAYQTVKEFLISNPNAQADQIVNATGISFDKLRKFWDGGRLKAETAGDYLAGQKLCRTCNTPISVGELCSKCYVERQAFLDANGSPPNQRLNQPLNDKRDVGFKKIEKKELKSRMHTKKYKR